MKLTRKKCHKPRNPVATPARLRKAGPHQKAGKALRRQTKQVLGKLAHEGNDDTD